MAENAQVLEFKHENNERDETSSDDKSNLIINYLPVDIDDFMLKNLFAEHGNIQQTKVVRDKITKKSLGVVISDLFFLHQVYFSSCRIRVCEIFYQRGSSRGH